ncbi:uncharacterized protein METZ01_LOCUS298077 [marine metagenome]|uniref:Uncharacterized protein n=1 Tax=marine metagenome TaxID=408172 RepID=A0A382M8E1_9ZZZZ
MMVFLIRSWLGTLQSFFMVIFLLVQNVNLNLFVVVRMLPVFLY